MLKITILPLNFLKIGLLDPNFAFILGRKFSDKNIF